MRLTTKELALLLHFSLRTTQRIYKTLNLPHKLQSNKLIFTIPSYHPLYKSISLANEYNTLPVLSIHQLSNLIPHFRSNDYVFTSHDTIINLLKRHSIPLYSNGGKKFVYLSDLLRLND